MQDDKNLIIQMRFPQKLWYLLNMRTDAILWGGTGRTILLNFKVLEKYLQCDHSIFKTTNISSFVRQLNLYGFRKVTSHLQDPLCNSFNPYMHEYVHDYFQCSRPELLNKITRKALAMRKNFRPKSFYHVHLPEQLGHLTPLQKARRSFHEALNKAAHDLFFRNSTQNYSYEEHQDLYESITFTTKIDKNTNHLLQSAESDLKFNIIEDNVADSNISQENNLMSSIMEDSSRQSNDFPAQFLDMPDLGTEPNDMNNVDLLAEFNIAQDGQHQNLARNIEDGKEPERCSLNCVLPSINNDTNDDVTMSEKNKDTDHYNGEWEQMFSDIINKENNQEYSSDLKEWYSQISRTIDLLND